jgi:hypothetical protein
MLTTVVDLNAVEARIIGSLAEKQLTTPQQYPLTLNALVVACNQTSNRDPVVVYDDGIVEAALASLKDSGVLRFVHPGHGRSATRYRQVLDERFGLDERGLSLLAVLLLRGPQTIGELRARTERMADFGSLDGVGTELERMAGGPDPLVCRLPRRPGQKEERWTQLLAGDPPEADASSDAEFDATVAAEAVRSVSLDDVVTSLRADVDALREEVQRISSIVEQLRSTFDL